MPLKLAISLLLLPLSVCGICANASSSSALLAQETTPSKKPTPTPTPPPGGPNPSNPGGPSKDREGKDAPERPGKAIPERPPKKPEEEVASVLLAQDTAPSKKPTPVPTPPPGGPNPSNPGGPSKEMIILGRTMEVSNPSAFETNRATELKYKRKQYLRTLDYRSLSTYGSRYSCDPNDDEPANLTGTYSGKLVFPGRELSGNATLTVEGQHFSLVSDNLVLSGNIAAVTTCNYTAVALRYTPPDSNNTSTDAAESISLRAKLAGSDLSLTSVEGQPEFEFTPISKASRRRRRR